MKKETKIILIFLVVVLFFLVFQLWRQYTYIQRAQTAQAIRGNISQEMQQLAVLRQRGPLTATDVSYIQSWMTFDYINVTFNIPPQYLSDYLASSTNNNPINNNPMHNTLRGYPHISISHYARENGFNPTVLTTGIVSAVQTYLNELHP
jgi:hypothetical protein